MAHLFKQQPLQNSSLQEVSIIAQCSGVICFQKSYAEHSVKGINWSVMQQAYLQVLFWDSNFS